MKKMVSRTSLFWILLLIVSAIHAGCGILGEKEPAPESLTLQLNESSCNFPDFQELVDPDTVSVSMILGATDCLKRQLNDAFQSVRGGVAGELTIPELQTLEDRGVIHFNFNSSRTWDLISGAVTFLHSEGHSAIQQAKLNRLIRWMRSHAELYVEVLQINSRSGSLKWDQMTAIFDALEELKSMFSPQGRLTLTQAEAIAEIQGVSKKRKSRKQQGPSLSAKIEALWKLKGLILESPQGQKYLNGESLIQLMDLALRVARQLPQTFTWAEDGRYRPGLVPSVLDVEWKKSADLVIEYLSQRRLSTVSSDDLRGIVRTLAGDPNLADLTPDFVRLSQRLTVSTDRTDGIHSRSLIRLLKTLPGIAQDFKNSAPAFSQTCKKAARCNVTLRQVYQNHPVLKKIALKGKIARKWDWWEYDENGYSTLKERKRLDSKLDWREAMRRMILRRFMNEAFFTFDKNQDGKIPLFGKRSEETQEAMDLAYTLLRFMSFSNHSEDGGGKKSGEESISNPVILKPAPLYRVIELVGDQWMPDGNQDGALDADELFAVISVYDDIQNIARGLSSSPYSQTLYSDKAEDYPSGSNRIFSRFHFIENLSNEISDLVPHLYPSFQTLPPQIRNSLFHSLVPIPESPLEVYASDDYWQTRYRTTLNQYAREEAALPPAALIAFIDRLMLLCDKDEDEELSWSELDCAVPLLLSTGEQIVKSDLVELAPIAHDGSRLLFRFLNGSGVPQSLVKLALINGGVRKLYIPDDALQQIEGGLVANWHGVATFVSFLEQGSVTTAEMQKRYGACDQNDDAQLERKELDCLTRLLIAEIPRYLNRLSRGYTPPEYLEFILEFLNDTPFVKVAAKLAVQNEDSLRHTLEELPLFHSSPQKLLRLLENILRSGEELCEQPGC